MAGRFRIVRAIGVGGMGCVFEIEHELTKHRRALKLLHSELLEHPDIVARFLREASAAGRIGNPHIVETFDAGKLENGQPYLVMEYLEGQALSDKLARTGRLSSLQLIELFRQICDGVQAAHDRGIIHRDLKPENIFITNRQGQEFVKILDFGISSFDSAITTGGAGLTEDSSTLGTPCYMPPEQIGKERSPDARTDVYAIGVMLYECASGVRPFEAESLSKLFVKIGQANAVPVLEHRPDLPPEIGLVLEKAMARDYERRFPSARELERALAACLLASTSPMGDPTTSLSEQGRGAQRRRPRGEPRKQMALVGAGVLTMGVAAVVAAFWRSPVAHDPARIERAEAVKSVVACERRSETEVLATPEIPGKTESEDQSHMPVRSIPPPPASSTRIGESVAVRHAPACQPQPSPIVRARASRTHREGLADNPFK